MRIEGMDANSYQPIKMPESVPLTNDIKSDTKEVAQMTAAEKKKLPVPERVMADAIEKANKAISGANRYFEYSVHEKTGEIMIKVMDSESKQVVREIPPEKILDLVANLMEMAGLLVDERR